MLGPDSGFGADAMTVTAYLGFGALRPVLDRAANCNGAAFVIVRSSNSEGCSVQNARLGDGRIVADALAVRQHKDQIIGLARNEEAAEKGEHPLNRIISIEETDEGLVISTTDIHLPRRIGEALKRAFHGELAMHFDEAGYFVRVDWHASA